MSDTSLAPGSNDKETPPTTTIVLAETTPITTTVENSPLTWLITTRQQLYLRIGVLLVVTTYNIWNIAYIGSIIYLQYLTNWHWILINTYFISASIQSYCYIYKRETFKPKVDIAMKYLFAMTPTLAVLVTVLYWVLLNDEALNSNYSLPLRIRGGGQHTVNSVITLVDLYLGTAMTSAKLVVVPLLFLIAYQLNVFIFYAARTNWPYTFLRSVSGTVSDEIIDWGPTIGFLIGILAVTALTYLGVCGVIYCREMHREKRGMGRTRQPSAEMPNVEANPYSNL